ncbi:MAG: choice-of-anchor L domain-containing protein [Flavobacteriia bacterium]|nr:choice-of-anchor L domain-containing protein [Flavobacteriia bacterium]
MKVVFYISFFICFFSNAQLVTTVSSPQAMVQNVLLGEGVEISNVNFTGSSQAIGHFTAYGTNLGINEGIVITTGTILGNPNGPLGPNNSAGSGVDNGLAGNTQLTNLVGTSTFDASVLEFDFVSVGDFVSFKYVFASEEYLEYVGTEFNDVFALYISGPGITGSQNIAKLPNGTVVSINNVNTTSNSFYYVDNGDGSQAPYNSSTNYIQYDGFTKVLTASSTVQCGKTYHLKIAIADVGDGILDSGIFLEAQSLESNAPYTSSYSINPIHFGSNDIVAEGCTSVNVHVEREDVSSSISFPIQISGSASEGIDYGDIPNQITFNPGQNSFDFSFDIFADGLNEGDETIQIILMLINECLEPAPETISLTIRNVNPVNVILPPDSLLCGPGETKELVPIVTGGLEPYVYSWSTGQSTSSIFVSPPSTQVFSVSVTDACLNSTDDDDAEIFVADIPPLEIIPFDVVSVLCPNTPHFFTANAIGGTPPYTFFWRYNNAPIGNGDTITLSPLQTSTYTLIVNDMCGLQTSLDFEFIVETPMLIPSITTPSPICPYDTTSITASATLGLGEYSYFWPHSGDTSPTVVVAPPYTTTFIVEISDECQSYFVPIGSTVTVFKPLADFSYNTASLDINQNIHFFDNSNNAISYFWNFDNGISSEEKNPIIQFNEVGTYNVTLIIEDELGCKDTVTKPINVGYLMYFPNTFTPDGNRFNNEFFGYLTNIDVREFELFNRWGELIFHVENQNRFSWDGNFNEKPCPDGTYTYRIRYVIPSLEEKVFVGHVNLLR